MKTVVAVLALVLLTGCAGMNPFGAGQELAVPTSLSETGQEAAKIINGIKVGLIVAKNTVNQQAGEGLMLKPEAIAARAWIDERWKEAKKAEGLLGDGKDILAKGQAELIEKALAEFQRQLMARAKKGTT
jgi:hypothetical protein